MRTLAAFVLAALFIAICSGCAHAPPNPPGPRPVAEAIRGEIGRLAIRGPTNPKVALTSMVDNKGAAAGKTARAAGLGWLGGSMRAAVETGDPFAASLLAAFGLVTAPVVAAGGALYGAAAADSGEAVENGNAVIRHTLAFMSGRFLHILESAFDQGVPVDHAFVPGDTSDEVLMARGFDSVLDIRMDSISSLPSTNQLEVLFELLNSVSLTSLHDRRLLEHRRYFSETTHRNVSEWANDDAKALNAALSEALTGTVQEITEAFFLAPAIRVQGLEPVSKQRFGTGKISGTRPMFVWSALDGASSVPQPGTDYEILIQARNGAPAAGVRTPAARYVPAESLEACTRYEWKVRAHYLSFGRPTTSDWSPTYRFRTPCE